MKSRLAARVHRARAGYTIMEVMVVLAVTGAIFLSAALMLGGRQAVTEMTQAVRDMESRIQSISNDVQTGFYPSGYACDVPGAGSPTIGGAADPDLSGSNRMCISIGKVFAIHQEDSHIMTMVGRHYRSAPPAFTDISDLEEAQPVVVELASGASPSSVSVSDYYEYKYGLQVTKVVSVQTGTEYAAIAFITELANSTASGTPVTGSRATRVYGVSGTALSDTLEESATKSNVPSAYTEEPGGVRICLVGGNGTVAEIEVGSSSDNSSTLIKIADAVGTDCD